MKGVAAPAAHLRVQYEDSSSAGISRCGVVAVPRVSPAGLGVKPTAADMEQLRPVVRAHEEALAALEDGLDWHRLNHTFAPLTALVQALAGADIPLLAPRVHNKCLSASALQPSPVVNAKRSAEPCYTRTITTRLRRSVCQHH